MGRKRRAQQTQAACECLFLGQISNSMTPSPVSYTQSPADPGNLLLCVAAGESSGDYPYHEQNIPS